VLPQTLAASYRVHREGSMSMPRHPHVLNSSPPSPDDDLTLQVGERGFRTVLALTGEIDIGNSDVLARRLTADIDRTGPGREVVVDLSSVRFCAAAGITALLDVHRHCRDRRTPLVFTGAAGQVLQVIRLTRADEVLPLALIGS